MEQGPSLSLPPVHCHHWRMAVLPDYYLKIIGETTVNVGNQVNMFLDYFYSFQLTSGQLPVRFLSTSGPYIRSGLCFSHVLLEVYACLDRYMSVKTGCVASPIDFLCKIEISKFVTCL